MLARSGPLPTEAGWSYELKWDGFRAIVRSGREFRVRSRRGWNMTPLLPELAALVPPTTERAANTALSFACGDGEACASGSSYEIPGEGSRRNRWSPADILGVLSTTHRSSVRRTYVTPLLGG
jgi:ATP-dependent DNA ligase